jgi:hypothetical protein
MMAGEPTDGQEPATTRIAPLRHLPQTDPDRRARQRAHAVLLAEERPSSAAAARLFTTSALRVRVWPACFGAAPMPWAHHFGTGEHSYGQLYGSMYGLCMVDSGVIDSLQE